MNDKSIAFIICMNNMEYYQECVRYIQELEVPEGYETDIICVQEAESMAMGYNAGMQDSDAKYKVYLHEDTFVINTHFIYDILEIFQNDKTIGMLGVVGCEHLPDYENCYLNYNIGNIEEYDGVTTDNRILYQDFTKKYIEVEVAEGVLIATQYDIAWSEEFFDSGNSYDISQSMQMRKMGYKIVVPYQEKAWCYHDRCPYKVENDEIDNLRRALIHLIEERIYGEIFNLLGKINEIDLKDQQICEILNLAEIYDMEEKSATGQHSEWFSWGNWYQMYEYYQWVRFVIMRIEWDREDERKEILKHQLENGTISKDAIRKIANISFRNHSRVFQYLLQNENCNPLVSVIVPVYNTGKLLKETIDSILAQTYQNMEIIIVDDASTDESRSIISAYEDIRIRKIFLEKNRHICYSGNVGFKEAKGKYIALIGHDDLWKEDKIEKQVSFLEEHPTYGICFTWVDIIDGNNNFSNNHNWGLHKKFCSQNSNQYVWIRKLFLEGNCFCAPSACMRRDILEMVGYYRYGLVQLQDYDLWMRFLREAPVYILQEKLTYYRLHTEEGKNLSFPNIENQNREKHEWQWIQDDFLNKVSNKIFVLSFKEIMKNPNSIENEEIECEKAFLQWDCKNCFAEKRFIELLESEACRETLEKKYYFELKDFYKMNTQSMCFDNGIMLIVKQLEEKLKDCKKNGI